MTAYESFDLLSPLSGSHGPAPVRAEGACYWTAEGKQMVDLNEMRVILGQNNTEFQAGMARALAGNTAPKQGISPAKLELCRYLDRTTSGHFSAVHLTSSGSEAVEWAVRLAKKITGRSEVLSFWNSIHGRTYLSASLSGLPKRKVGHGPLAPGVVLLPYPNCAQCPVEKKCKGYNLVCLEAAKRTYRYASAQDAAAIILEPYQGAGVVLPPPGYLYQLQEWARSQGMLVIVDEVQSGMGRTGWMHLYQREGLDPDMLLLGKALGNGLHIAALLVRERPDAEALAALAGGSGDDPVACAAACQVFQQLENGLLSHVRSVGQVLQEGLKTLESSPVILQCRGVGLAGAVEFADKTVCDKAMARLSELGYLPGQLGSVLYCKPPYVITEEQVRGFLAALAKALGEVERG